MEIGLEIDGFSRHFLVALLSDASDGGFISLLMAILIALLMAP